MRKRWSSDGVRVRWAAVAVAISLLAPSAAEAEDLELELAVAKSRLLVCEPLVALVTLKGTRPVLGDGSEVVYLVDRGSGFVPFQRPIFVSEWHDARKPQSLPPSGRLIETVLSYDGGTRDCVLPSAGRFRLVAEYREKGLPTVRSNVLKLKVQAPTGDEAEAFADLTRYGRVAFYVGDLAVFPLEIAGRHPASVYVQHGRLAALTERIRLLFAGQDPEEPGAHPAGKDRKALAAFARPRKARLLPQALDIVKTSGQFRPRALLLLASVQEAADDLAGARATYERIVRDHPGRSAAEEAREELEGDEE